MNAPQDYKTAGIFMLISGILTILASLALIGTLIWVCVGVFWFLTLGAAIFELVVGISVMNGKFQSNAKTAAIVGLIAAFLCGNLIGVVLEILALVFLGKIEVSTWLDQGGSIA